MNAKQVRPHTSRRDPVSCPFRSSTFRLQPGFMWGSFNLQGFAVLATALAETPFDPELIYEAMKHRV